VHRAEVAIEAAKAAGSVLSDGQNEPLVVEGKGASRTSIVTSVDLQSQKEIVRVIRKYCPHDLIIGEEGTDGDAANISRWYVDPLDGTSNYVHGLGLYCVSIAYCDEDGINIGVVYDPVRDDLFTAERGHGAKKNGKLIAVSPSNELRASLIATQVQSDDGLALDQYAKNVRALVAEARAVRSLGTPALSLAYVANGSLDAFLEVNMDPWDTLAGTLLVREAGGKVSTFDGASRSTKNAADILATNGRLHEHLVGILS
jgi:myo-inositol-1(or 4)-monophosphatase